MRQLALTRAAVLTPFEFIEEATVLIRQGRIISIGAGRVGIPEGFREISLEGLILTPGLIDICLHSRGEAAAMSGDVASLSEMARFSATHGVTSFLATITSVTNEQLHSVAAAYSKLVHSDYKGSRCLGLHLEFGGGAVETGMGQNVSLPALTVAEVERLQQISNFGIKKITLDPQMPGASELAAQMVRRGITCSIGRSRADFATTVAAVENGFSSVTHCFEQLRPFNCLKPGVVGAAMLHKGLTVEIIADERQIHPATLELVWRLKGRDGIILTSAAMTSTGSAKEEGPAGIGDNPVTLEQVVRNFWQSTGCELSEAFCMATYNPAKQLGLSDFKGSLAPGKDADIIAVTPDFDVVMTMIAGEIISGLIAV